jgi:hypothetical protein
VATESLQALIPLGTNSPNLLVVCGSARAAAAKVLADVAEATSTAFTFWLDRNDRACGGSGRPYRPLTPAYSGNGEKPVTVRAASPLPALELLVRAGLR